MTEKNRFPTTVKDGLTGQTLHVHNGVAYRPGWGGSCLACTEWEPTHAETCTDPRCVDGWIKDRNQFLGQSEYDRGWQDGFDDGYAACQEQA